MDDVNETRLLQVLHAGRGGKRAFDAASKARLVEACLTPGVSISRLALENGINANLLRTWIRKYRKLKAPGLPAFSPLAEVSPFVPVLAAHAERAADIDRKPGGMIEPSAQRRERSVLANGEGAASGLRAQVSLPNGVTLSVELGDASMMAAMIGALGNVPSVG